MQSVREAALPHDPQVGAGLWRRGGQDGVRAINLLDHRLLLDGETFFSEKANRLVHLGS